MAPLATSPPARPPPRLADVVNLQLRNHLLVIGIFFRFWQGSFSLVSRLVATLSGCAGGPGEPTLVRGTKRTRLAGQKEPAVFSPKLLSKRGAGLWSPQEKIY